MFLTRFQDNFLTITAGSGECCMNLTLYCITAVSRRLHVWIAPCPAGVKLQCSKDELEHTKYEHFRHKFKNLLFYYYLLIKEVNAITLDTS